MGPIMVLFGFAWFIGNLAATRLPALVSIGAGFEGLNTAILAHLLLAYPTGRLVTRSGRALVSAIYAVIVLGGLARLLTFDPRGAFPDCSDCIHGSLAAWPTAFATVDDVMNAIGAVLALGV